MANLKSCLAWCRRLPQGNEVGRSILVGLLLGSLLGNWVWYENSKLFESKFDEMMETARLNDLDGDGRSLVEVIFSVEKTTGRD